MFSKIFMLAIDFSKQFRFKLVFDQKIYFISDRIYNFNVLCEEKLDLF